MKDWVVLFSVFVVRVFIISNVFLCFCAMINVYERDANVNVPVIRASFREDDFRVNDFSKHQLLAKIILKNHRTDFSFRLLEYAHLAFKK